MQHQGRRPDDSENQVWRFLGDFQVITSSTLHVGVGGGSREARKMEAAYFVVSKAKAIIRLIYMAN